MATSELPSKRNVLISSNQKKNRPRVDMGRRCVAQRTPFHLLSQFHHHHHSTTPHSTHTHTQKHLLHIANQSETTQVHYHTVRHHQGSPPSCNTRRKLLNSKDDHRTHTAPNIYSNTHTHTLNKTQPIATTDCIMHQHIVDPLRAHCYR